MSEQQPNESTPQLSERELEILRLVATGASNKEIASQLVLSINTVKVHLRNIFAKIGAQSRTEATMYAVRQGWVKVPAEARAEPMTEEPEAEAETESQVTPPPSLALRGRAGERAIEPPLPWPQRIALVIAAALVVVGLGVTWPQATIAGNGAGNEVTDSPGADIPALAPRGDSRWHLGAPMPTARGRLALVSWNDKLYAIGGNTSPGGVTGAVEIYDTAKNVWSPGANKPTPVANVTAVVLNKIIVPGGSLTNGMPTSTVELYDPQTDAWSNGTALPSPVLAYALAVYDGKAYLFGGKNNQGYSGQVLVYDAATDRWTQRAPMPTPRGFAAAATLDKAVYVVGGYDGRREFATCERYLPDQDAWEPCAPLTIGRGGLGLAALASRLYAVGGGWSGYVAFGERYDPATNVWTPIETPLTGQWRNLAATAYRMDIFTVGGWSGQSYLAVTEKYSPFPWTITILSP